MSADLLKTQTHTFIVQEVPQRLVPAKEASEIDITDDIPEASQAIALETPLSFSDLAPLCNSDDTKHLRAWFRERADEQNKGKKGPSSTAVVLRRLPKELQHCMNRFLQVAQDRLDKANQTLQKEPFNCFRAEMLNDTIIDCAVDAIRNNCVPGWTILGTKVVHHFCATGRLAIESPPPPISLRQYCFFRLCATSLWLRTTLRQEI